MKASTVGVQIEGQHGVRDVRLTLADEQVTAAEVFEAVGLGFADFMVDESSLESPDVPASSVLADGVRLWSGTATNALEHSGTTEVSVVAGLDAGSRVTLPAGSHRVDANFSDPSGCWYFRVPVVDAEPQPWHVHGASIEALHASNMVLAIGGPILSEGSVAAHVHRPPRLAAPASVTPVTLREPPKQVPPPAPLSWATLLAPIPIALLMAVFFRPLFAVFAAMGPIVALARWYEARRRYRRNSAARAVAVIQVRAELALALKNQAEALAQLRWLRHPHVAELFRRARQKSVRTWERRLNSTDFLCATLGVGAAITEPVLGDGTIDDEVHNQANQPLVLRSVPHTIDLDQNSGIGICGDRSAALAVARSLVLQLVTLHGPADLTVGIVCARDADDEWDWLKWLPHLDTGLVAHATFEPAKVIGQRQNLRPSTAEPSGPVRLMIIDDPNADVAALQRASHESKAELRILSVADSQTALPAACSSVMQVSDGTAGTVRAEVTTPELAGQQAFICPSGVSLPFATRWARALSALQDPELVDSASTRSDQVSLLTLVGFTTSEALRSRWNERAVDAPPVAVVGVSNGTEFVINLVEDGPHGLVAGTTGSGKSELLRTLVISLAASCPPEHLNFVLVDFKGGGAFDVVDRLPHVAGLITDLDETLVVRAISSLRAELHRREGLFRELEVSTFDQAAQASTEPLARLVIVIDEFGALATDYSELMTAIVDLAARGRSLGMHLILATQRPSGVVDQKIRANTNLRVALRVQDAFDSQDVIGTAAAASIDRKNPGRAIFSVGGDTPVTVQTAFSGAPDRRAQRCTVAPHQLFAPSTPQPNVDGCQTELSVLLQAITELASERSYSARPLWVEPLPATLDWIELGTRVLSEEDGTQGIAIGLVDLPDKQLQLPWRWDPDAGALALYGSSASCAASTLTSLGVGLASSASPSDLHLYVVDGGGQALQPLLELPHTGAWVTVGENDRLLRVVTRLERTLADRRSSAGSSVDAKLVLMIDNVASVLAMFDDIAGAQLIDRLVALARDGATQGIHTVFTARTVRDIPHRLAQQIPNRLVLDLADPTGFLALGLKSRDLVPLPKMRAQDLSDGRVVQLVEPPDFSRQSFDHDAADDQLPKPILTFPDQVLLNELPAARLVDDALVVPIGVQAGELDEAALTLRSGDHALIAAPTGRGRSTVLTVVAHQLAALAPAVQVVRIGSKRSPLRAPGVPGRVVEAAPELTALLTAVDAVDSDRTTDLVLLVDDAELIDDDLIHALAPAVARDSTHRVIVAATPDFARGVRAWTAPIRSGGIGVILAGTVLEADLFKVRLPAVDGLGVLPGRGHVIERGRASAAQFAGVGSAPNARHDKV